jgi:hypothetical protein
VAHRRERRCLEARVQQWASRLHVEVLRDLGKLPRFAVGETGNVAKMVGKLGAVRKECRCRAPRIAWRHAGGQRRACAQERDDLPSRKRLSNACRREAGNGIGA